MEAKESGSEILYGELSRYVTEHAGKDGRINEQYKYLQSSILRATNSVCDWTEELPRHKVTWCWDGDEVALKEKKKIV